MKRLRRTLVFVGLALGLSVTASALAMPHVGALDGRAAASGEIQRQPDVASPGHGRAASTVRAQSSGSPNENDDRGSSPVFAFVCALIGFAVIVYLVLRRMRSGEPASTQA